MATNDASASSSDPTAVEQIFSAVCDGPLDQFMGLLETLPDVNVTQGADQTTLLHLSVKFGKLDRVEALLGRGADPFLLSADGSSPLKLAEEMAEQSPDDMDRQLILRFVRVVQKRVVRQRTPGADTSEGYSAAEFQEMINGLKQTVEALNGEMPQFVTKVIGSFQEVKTGLNTQDGVIERLTTAVTASKEEFKALKEKLVEKNLIPRAET